MNVELFQQRVNEMLIKIPDFNEEWRLGGLLQFYHDFMLNWM